MIRFALAVAALVALPTSLSAQGADPLIGNWMRDDGGRTVRISKCGESYCGSIAAIKDPNDKAKVGQSVFSGIKQSAPGKYTGTAIDPDDGKQYSGSFTLNGNTLSAGGCALGGLICRTRNYRRM